MQLNKLKLFAYVFLALTSLSCRKSNLTGEHSKLVGIWAWTEGYEDDGKTSWRLEFLQKGKYKLSDDKKVLESGRIQIENGKVIFISNSIRPKVFLDQKNCRIVQYDCLEVSKFELTDQPVSVFKKL